MKRKLKRTLYPSKSAAAWAGDGPNTPHPAPPVPEPCHRCNGTGEVLRYRMDGSIKTRTVCPCRLVLT